MSMITLEIAIVKVYSFVGVHPANPDQFLVSSKTTVTFFSYDQSSSELCSHNPGSIEKEFGKSCGHLTQSVYLRNTRQVLSATTRGNLVVWLTTASAETPLPKWKPTRLLRLEEEGISALVERDGFVAVADNTGSVTFYNEELQKVKWVQNFSVGKILSLSYRVEDESFERKGNEIILSDFIISVEGSLCGYVNFSTGNLQTLIYGKGAPWTFHDIHPSKNTLILGNIYGFVSTYNYLSNEHVSDKDLNIEDEITCIKYSTLGDLLAVGTKKGYLWLLNEETLDPVRSMPFAYSKGAIRSCQFSACGEFLATADTDRCVSVYKQNKLLGTPWQWELLGRYRGHSRPVLQMLFGKDPETNGRLLLTLGKDMKLNEYDLESSSISDGLILLHRTEVEQRCQPTCMAWYPPGATEENFLVLANKHQKQRLINMGTKMCRKVVLGPQQGSKHISKMKFIPGLQGLSPMKNTDGYFAISCGTYLALQKIPLSGSPFSCMAKLGNPKGIDELFLSPTGKYCFTMNKEDECFQQWDIDPLVLEDFSLEGGTGSEAFFSLLPDKKESKLFKDMKDYFCYVQIEKGATSLSNKIPLDDVPTVCRALGFYPTEREIEDMMNEIKYSNYVNTGQLETDIVLEDFLQLFLNHKPVKGEDISELEKVFKIIGKNNNEDQNTVPNINRHNLIDFLKSRGDTFKEKDFNQYVKPLFTSNYSNTPREDVQEEHNEFYHIPEEISYKDFVRGALKISENFSFKSELTRGVSLNNDTNLQIVLDDNDLPIKA